MFTPSMLVLLADMETYGDWALTMLFVFILAIPFFLMRIVFFKTTKHIVKFALLMLMFAQYIIMVLWTARLYTGQLAAADQISYAWIAAVLTAAISTVGQAVVIYICRPRRQMREEDKMKLKDL